MHADGVPISATPVACRSRDGRTAPPSGRHGSHARAARHRRGVVVHGTAVHDHCRGSQELTTIVRSPYQAWLTPCSNPTDRPRRQHLRSSRIARKLGTRNTGIRTANRTSQRTGCGRWHPRRTNQQYPPCLRGESSARLLVPRATEPDRVAPRYVLHRSNNSTPIPLRTRSAPPKIRAQVHVASLDAPTSVAFIGACSL